MPKSIYSIYFAWRRPWKHETVFQKLTAQVNTAHQHKEMEQDLSRIEAALS